MATTLKRVSQISGAYGQDGEERLAELLEQELPDHYLILNSPRIAYREEIVDIDHIVIAPTGIYVIECKNMNGRISGGLMGNWVQERTVAGRREIVKIGNPASQVNHYTKILRDYVRNTYSEVFKVRKNFKFEPIVVFSHEQSNISRMNFTSSGRIGKVMVCLIKDIVPYLLSREKVYLSQEEMDQCAEIIVPADQRDQTGVYDVLAAVPYKERFYSRYQISEELGRGSFGNVFRAFDNKLDREVAVKKIDPRYSQPDDVERFVREAKITAKLNHENIVTFYDYYEEDDGIYIVMELVEGLTLGELLDAGDFSLREIKNIFGNICLAVSYAHENGVIHRDLKAANILITENQIAKITDFGVARLIDDNKETQNKTSIGTPNNMAPEQVLGNPVDQRSDVFALGVLLYQMLTGKLPFHGESLGEVVHKILKEEPQPPSSIIGGENLEGIDKIVLKCLAKDPNNRFQTVLELISEFNMVVEGLIEPYGSREGILELLFRGEFNWSRFWKDDKAKFYGLFFVTVLVMMWLISLQFFWDSRVDKIEKEVSTNKAIIEKEYEKTSTKAKDLKVSNKNIGIALNNLDVYLDAKVNLVGEIESIEGQSEAGYIVKVKIKQINSSDSYYLYVAFKGDPHLLFSQGELYRDIRVAGVLDKLLTNTNDSIPLVLASHIEKITPWLVLSPTLLELEVDKEVTNDNTQITIKRVEFAEDETRLYLTVKNTSEHKKLIVLQEIKGIQGAKEIRELYHVESNYTLELEPGQATEGTVVLGEADYNLGEIQIQILEGSLASKTFVFDIDWSE